MPETDRNGRLDFIKAQLALIIMQSQAVERGDYDEAVELGRRFGCLMPSLRRVTREARQGCLEAVETKAVLEIMEEIRRIQSETTQLLKERQANLACILQKVNNGRAAVASYAAGRRRPMIFELSA